MVRESKLQKPVKATMRKDAKPDVPCPSCGSTEVVRGVLYHKANCKLYARKA